MPFERDHPRKPPETPEPLPAPRPSAAGLLALQRSAGNAAVTAMLHRWPLGMPDLSRFTPVDPAVEREWTAELRRQAGNRMDKAFVKYAQAVQTIKEEMAAEKAQPSLIAELVAVALGALAPGLSGMLVTRIKAGLRPVAETTIKNFGAATALTAEQLVDHFVLVDTPSAIAGAKAFFAAVTAPAAPAGAGPEPRVAPPLGGEAPTGGARSRGAIGVPELLLTFSQQFSVYLSRLDEALGTMDRAAVLGIWAAFDPARVTHELYCAQIRDLVRQHQEIGEYAADDREGFLGDTVDRGRIVMLSANGVRRPALLQFRPGSAIMMRRPYWTFVKWVAPELAQTAQAAGDAQRYRASWGGPTHRIGLEEVAAGEPFPFIPIQGHIDDPRSEGERIAELELFGRVRLARVDVEGSGGRFLGWVPAAEEAFARVKGERQPGGIGRLDPTRLDGVPAHPPRERG